MSDYRRWFVAGGTFFFTLVTHERRPFLTSETARRALREAIETVRHDRPFSILAIVLLPDHLHTVWSLPPDETDYSTRIRRIKGIFTRGFLGAGGTEGKSNASRQHRGERAFWQRRFWEHMCRDEADLKQCIDYIHWNPRKHGIVTAVADYPWSSFHRYVHLGEYDRHWGKSDPCPDWNPE